MDKKEKYDDLMVLALSLGFIGRVDENKKLWLVTKYKGQPLPIAIDPESEDLFCGKASIVLGVIDDRLGLDLKEDRDLSKRFKELEKAFSNKNHKFWDIAKKNN